MQIIMSFATMINFKKCKCNRLAQVVTSAVRKENQLYNKSLPLRF